MARTEIRILGPLEAAGKDGSLSLPKGRARALLAILALHPAQVISTDRLLDHLWGASPPATARTKLHGLVSSLRKALSQRGPDEIAIETRPPGYALAIDPDRIDALLFRRMIEQARSLPPAGRIDVLRAALALWRGPVLADFRYEPFAQAEISTYEDLRITAIEERMDAELEVGRHMAVIPDLEALIAEHPFRERLRAMAMLALYRSGNQQKALQVAHDTYVTLREELGVEPGPELRELEHAILNHDPRLQLAQSPASGDLDDPPGRLLAETRKTVTIVFIDVGARPGHGSDPETQRAATLRQHETINQTIHRYGGSVQGSIGGVTVSVFGLPIAHEDDPMRAVRAAAELIAHASEGVVGDLRIGINTGEVVIGEPPVGSNLSGSTPRMAAHLQQAAKHGEVLLGDETRRQVGGAAVVKARPGGILDDAGHRLPAWKLIRAELARPKTMSRDAGWVGRQDELARLIDAAQKAAETGRPVRLTVIGEAGIGKSRLAAEFAASLGDAYTVLTGQCPPYGDGITFWPLREIIQAAAGGSRPEQIGQMLAGVDDANAIARQLGGAVGATEYPGRPDVLFPAVGRFFEALAHRSPLVVIFDDLHWAQPTFVDLVEYLTDSVHSGLVLLCLARPEFLELRPSWNEPGATVLLPPLDPAQAAQLVELGLVDQDLAYGRADEIIQLAGGNPLFLEQILAALGDNEELTIPTSLQALLVARLDRLGPAERDMVRAASVWGGSFRTADLVELLPIGMHASIPLHVEALERKKLLTRSEEGGDFSFRHTLIQMAAYQTVTKDTRARLHETAVDVLNSGPDRGFTELDEVVGYHLEQAYTYRTELHLDDAHSRVLARRAGEHLSRAGIRAFGRLDAIAAEKLLSRALRLLPHDHPDRIQSTRYLVESYQLMGRHDDAGRLLDEIIVDAATSNDTTLEHFLRMERVWTRLATGPDPVSLADIEAETEQARRAFTAAGYDLGLAQIGRVEWHLSLRRGEMIEMEEAAYRSLDRASRSTSRRERIGSEWGVAMALEAGPRPVDECIERCHQVAGGIENPGVASALGYLHAMRGDFDKARGFVDEAVRILRERVRARRPMAQVKRRAGDVELMAGGFDSGERLLRESLDLNLTQGERDMVAQIAAELARVLIRQDRLVEADELAAMARAQSPRESITSQALWRAAQSLVHARHGDTDEAVRLAGEAAGLVPTGMLTLRANVLMDLSEVLALAGRHDEGAGVGDEAIMLFERKGNRPGAEMARASLAMR